MVYGYILFTASNMLSEGSELLLLVPSIAGIVGSVVLPILGAVPDGAIMLFSGLGPDAQQQMQVGVGALAGSTIMLLTVPWSFSILAGRVAIGADGLAQYKIRKRRGTALGSAEMLAKKLGSNTAQKHFLEATGVSPGSTIRSNAYVMVATSLVYLVIQGPAFAYDMEPSTDAVNRVVSHVERWWALGGLFLSIIAFVGYLFLMVQQADEEHNPDLRNRIDSAIIKALQTSDTPITLSGVLYPMIADGQAKMKEQRISKGLKQYSATLLDKDKKRLAKILEPFFHKARTPTPFTSRLIAGRAPARPTNRRLAV
jgi:Ca2+/Na+ antiporter